MTKKSQNSTTEPTTERRFMDTDGAAAYLGLSPRTLEKYRVYGGGPVYRKLGRRAVYTLEDLNIWADMGKRSG